MEPCVNCGTVEPVVPVSPCDCQCQDFSGGDARETRLLAPTRHEHDEWAANDPILPEGVLGLVKDRLFEGSVEYIIGDGEHTYSELLEEYRIYAGAPLSRTGKANHSPLAALGKSTLDPSWLPAATSNALGAVMVSTTGAAGKVPIPASGSSTLDPAWLPVSTSGAANKIPIADNNGKLDPSWLPEATSTTLGGVMASTTTAANNVVKADANGSLDGWKDAIVNTIENDNGGLVVDPNTGDLMVDFSQMPTDKFEALLKGLKMQIPLTGNIAFYVNQSHANASDNTDDIVVGNVTHKRGEADYPFKTIQACVNHATQTYAFGAYSGNIFVANGTYEESVRLPQFNRTSGNISLRALDEANPPTIATPSTSNYATPISISGGSWYLRRLNLSALWSDPGTDDLIHTSAVINVTGGSTFCDLKGCTISAEFTGPASTGWANPRIVSVADGAIVDLSVMQGYRNSFAFTKGNANASWIFWVSANSQVRFRSSNTENDAGSSVDMYEIPCSGSVHTFVAASDNSNIGCFAGGKYFPYFSGTMTGKKYSVTNYSRIEGPYGGFPGDTAGTPGAADSYKDMDTFARYSERSTPNS